MIDAIVQTDEVKMKVTVSKIEQKLKTKSNDFVHNLLQPIVQEKESPQSSPERIQLQDFKRDLSTEEERWRQGRISGRKRRVKNALAKSRSTSRVKNLLRSTSKDLTGK